MNRFSFQLALCVGLALATGAPAAASEPMLPTTATPIVYEPGSAAGRDAKSDHAGAQDATINNYLTLGNQGDRLVFDDCFSPGILSVGEPPQTDAVMITVSAQPVSTTKPFVHSYRLRNPTTHMELKADVSMPPEAQVGVPVSLQVNVLQVGVSRADDDAAEDFYLLLQAQGDASGAKITLQPNAPIGGTASSRKPQRASAVLTATWTPPQPGAYRVSIGFDYTDDSYAEVKRMPYVAELSWGRVCLDHLAELLFAQHMHARAICFGPHQSCAGPANVQELSLAEMAAFSGGGGFCTEKAAREKYRTFFSQHQNLFEGWQPTAPAAVVFAHGGGNALDLQQPVCDPTIHHYLGRTHRPYVALVDASMPDSAAALAAFRVIYLESPAYEMSTAQLAALGDYARQGGKLFFANGEITINGRKPAQDFWINSDQAPLYQRYPRAYVWRWRNPDSVTDPVTSDAGRAASLRMALYRKGDQLALHVVNCNVCLFNPATPLLDVDNVPLSIPLPPDWKSVSAESFDPDAQPQMVPSSVKDGVAQVTLLEVRLYKIVLLTKK